MTQSQATDRIDYTIKQTADQLTDMVEFLFAQNLQPTPCSECQHFTPSETSSHFGYCNRTGIPTAVEPDWYCKGALDA